MIYAGLDHTISEAEIATYLESARQAPRITSMLGEFADLATGRKGRPDYPIALDPSLLGEDTAALRFSEVRDRHAGVFNQHFITSLPYVLEEQCRFGAAVLDYADWLQQTDQRPLDYYALGDAAGVMGRALAECGNGRIRSLTCSPNAENEQVFDKGRTSHDAHFFLGPFFDVCPQSLKQRNMEKFSSGFDLIFEDTTFQMYGRCRRIPIALAMRNLRHDGIFVMLEKFSHPDPDEFLRREQQKDEDFKSRFYSTEKIEQKKKTIVHGMDQQLVTLDQYRSIASDLFEHAAIIWNTGNFYTIAASNSRERLAHFISRLIPPAIPKVFCYMDLPQAFIGSPGQPYAFRKPITVPWHLRP